MCDAFFRALPFIPPEEHVLVGLPDTVWFPENGFDALDDGDLSFLCFPVDRPELFDAVVMDEHDNVVEIQVKTPGARSNWIWGAFKLRPRRHGEPCAPERHTSTSARCTAISRRLRCWQPMPKWTFLLFASLLPELALGRIVCWITAAVSGVVVE